MSAYLSHLPPAPWHFRFDRESGSFYVCGEGGFPLLLSEKDDEAGAAALEFAALARNAEEVAARRGWHADRADDGTWYVPGAVNWPVDPFVWMNAGLYFPDAFTALVRTDEWLKALEAKIGDEREAWLTDPLGPSEHPDGLR